MIKCPFCQFENSDGTSLCQQCSSELGSDVILPPIPPPMLPAAEVVTAAPSIASSPVSTDSKLERPEGTLAPPMVLGVNPVMTQSGRIKIPGQIPVGVQPKLVVVRGLKVGRTYPLYEGQNFLGRMDEKPVDIDLEDQEPSDRIWTSRQHAVISYEQSILVIEDLNSSNGTFVNRVRVYPGERRQLLINDVVQIGTVHLKVAI